MEYYEEYDCEQYDDGAGNDERALYLVRLHPPPPPEEDGLGPDYSLDAMRAMDLRGVAVQLGHAGGVGNDSEHGACTVGRIEWTNVTPDDGWHAVVSIDTSSRNGQLAKLLIDSGDFGSVSLNTFGFPVQDDPDTFYKAGVDHVALVRTPLRPGSDILRAVANISDVPYTESMTDDTRKELAELFVPDPAMATTPTDTPVPMNEVPAPAASAADSAVPAEAAAVPTAAFDRFAKEAMAKYAADLEKVTQRAMERIDERLGALQEPVVGAEAAMELDGEASEVAADAAAAAGAATDAAAEEASAPAQDAQELPPAHPNTFASDPFARALINGLLANIGDIAIPDDIATQNRAVPRRAVGAGAALPKFGVRATAGQNAPGGKVAYNEKLDEVAREVMVRDMVAATGKTEAEVRATLGAMEADPVQQQLLARNQASVYNSIVQSAAQRTADTKRRALQAQALRARHTRALEGKIDQLTTVVTQLQSKLQQPASNSAEAEKAAYIAQMHARAANISKLMGQ